jgi:pyrroline-5-carboxylate reductase
MALDRPLAIIGGGTMGRAILEGAAAAGVLDLRLVVVAEPDTSRHPPLLRLGVHVAAEAGQALDWLEAHEVAGQEGVVLLAIKPQSLDGVAAEISARMGARRVISILAGTTIARLRGALGGRVEVVRAMPNTPARLRQGATAIAAETGTDCADAEALFSALGPLVVRIDEGLMDAFTALAGSGPAYLFYLARAMEEAGAKVGFDPETSSRIVRATLAGAAGLLAQSAEGPAALLAGVQSKGGTTEAAVTVLEAGGTHGAVVAAIEAARDRGRQLDRTKSPSTD